jgi:hypothetical protein
MFYTVIWENVHTKSKGAQQVPLGGVDDFLRIIHDYGHTLISVTPAPGYSGA